MYAAVRDAAGSRSVSNGAPFNVVWVVVSRTMVRRPDAFGASGVEPLESSDSISALENADAFGGGKARVQSSVPSMLTFGRSLQNHAVPTIAAYSAGVAGPASTETTITLWLSAPDARVLAAETVPVSASTQCGYFCSL